MLYPRQAVETKHLDVTVVIHTPHNAFKTEHLNRHKHDATVATDRMCFISRTIHLNIRINLSGDCQLSRVSMSKHEIVGKNVVEDINLKNILFTALIGHPTYQVIVY